jgi:hypothetical protein
MGLCDLPCKILSPRYTYGVSDREGCVACGWDTEKCQFSTEKCQFSTEKCQFSAEKCQFSTEKCQPPGEPVDDLQYAFAR